MKKVLFSMLLFSAFTAQAQFFQRHYGSTNGDQDFLYFGANTRLIGTGHVMTGSSYAPPSNTNHLIVVKTDQDGAITGPNDFGIDYNIQDAGGNSMTVGMSRAVEIDPNISSSNANYAVMGVVRTATATGSIEYIYYLELDNAGTPIGSAAFYYLGINPGDYYLNFTNARLSQDGRSLYAIGACRANTAQGWNGFIMKLDLTSSPVAVTWDNIFSIPRGGPSADHTYPHDVIESPYVSNPDVIVVGQSILNMDFDGFVQEFNINTGALSGNGAIYGASSQEDFQAINIMNNTAITVNGGFVVGGRTNFGLSGGTNEWLCFFDQGMTLAQSDQLEYTNGDGHILYDVIERQNTSSQYEYYTNGTYFLNSGGTNNEMLVMKYDPGALTVDVFLYGGTGSETGNSIDFYDYGGGPNGFSAYGNTVNSFNSAQLSDQYLVKAYFNGRSGCNELLTTGKINSGPVLKRTHLPVSLINFNSSSLIVIDNPALYADSLCYNSSITGGSNAFNLPVQPENQIRPDHLQLQMANPALANEPLELKIHSQLPHETVSIQLYDLQGRSFMLGTYPLASGQNHLQLNLPGNTLQKGIYLLRVNSGTEQKTSLLYLE